MLIFNLVDILLAHLGVLEEFSRLLGHVVEVRFLLCDVHTYEFVGEGGVFFHRHQEAGRLLSIGDARLFVLLVTQLALCELTSLLLDIFSN